MQCTYHPRQETNLRCGKCEKLICGRCVIQTPVGARCKECAQLRRIPTYTVSALFLIRGGVAGLVTGVALGVGLAYSPRLGIIPAPLLGWLAPLGLLALGYLVSEAVSAATNRKRGPLLQGVSIACYLLGYLVFELLTPWFLLAGILAIAAFIVGIALAMSRLR